MKQVLLLSFRLTIECPLNNYNLRSKTTISFFIENINYRLTDKNRLKSWISESCKKEGVEINSLIFVFSDDDFLLQINKKYLRHNTLTDIITFDLSDDLTLDGEIYISLDRVKDNAKKFDVKYVNEIHRVMIHGVLHLIGYNDKTPSQKRKMTAKEDYYLSLREF